MLWLRCYLCEKDASPRGMFCPACAQDFSWALTPRQRLPGTLLHLKIHSVAYYRGSVANFVKKMKSAPSGTLEEEQRMFLRDLLEHYACLLRREDFAAIVPVPGHPLRVWQETDLAMMVGMELARIFKKPLVPLLSQRKSWSNLFGASQKDKNPRARRQLRPAKKFAVRQAPLPAGVALLLVDDVCTTGSTLAAVAGLLRERGYRVREAMVLARSAQL